MVTANYTHGEPLNPELGSQTDPKFESLAQTRKEYGDLNFDESHIPESGHPIDLFKEWYDQAV